MRQEGSRRWLIVLMSVGLMALAPTRPADAQQEEVISGVVEPAEEDDDGNVLSVFIHDSSWGDVLIANSGQGRELLGHIGAEVEAEGRVEMLEDAEFGYLMYVSAYVLLDDPGGGGRDQGTRR